MRPAATATNDIFDKFTSVGEIGLAVTNFGVLGNGWNQINNRIQPSCQYKQHTDILRENVEHFSYAGLWIGGIVNDQKRVSTSIIDGVFDSGQEGFEFFSEPGMTIRSSISSTSQDSMAQYYSPYAVSHQDFLADFKDYYSSTVDNGGILNHLPLGIDVHLETYAWNFTFADAFVILNYSVKNASNDTIKDIYAGIWADASIGNMNYTDIYSPGGGFNWYDNLDGFDDTQDEAGFLRNIAYQYDADGDDGWAESYLGVTALGGNVPLTHLHSHYSQWVWSSSINSDYPDYIMPITDPERYNTMTSDVPKTIDPLNSLYGPEGYPAVTNSWLFMLSAGPYGSVPANADSSSWMLLPGDTTNIVFAIVCARWAGSGENSKERRENLHINADWAQKAYDGEDKNRNDKLDPGEDLNENGKIDRYILPEPPPTPNMAVEVGDQEVAIYWQDNAEDFIDPISREKDFEGYRIYGAHKTLSDNTSQEYTLLGEFDLADSVYGIGYNTGFDQIRITDENGNPDSVNINGHYYQYKFVNRGVKNGWMKYYSVTAFDRGDPASNLESLESAVSTNKVYVIPGVKADTSSDWVGQPTVYPNPYRGQAVWDGYGNREQMIWFQNLPAHAEIRIFSLAGDLVDVIEHDQQYNGQDIENINEQKNPTMSGGQHAWDLITKYDQAAATGLYMFTVENLDSKNKEIKEGKFLIIK